MTCSKRCVMSSSARRRPEPVLFVDRDAWSRLLGEALDAAGIAHVAHHEQFNPDAPDEDWLTVAGCEGWIVLTRDKMIRRRPSELAAVKAARVVMFVLGQGNMSAAETAQLVVSHYAAMMRRAKGARNKPAVFTLSRSGKLQAIKLR